MSGHRIYSRFLTVVAIAASVPGCSGILGNGIVDSKQTGFWEIVPPSTLNYLPGTIVTVEFTEDRKVKLHPTCEIDENYIRSKVEAKTVVRNVWNQFNNHEGDIYADIADYFTAKFRGARVQKQSVTIDNAEIYIASDELVKEIRQAHLKGNCHEAVMERINGGYKVCQTNAVMKGDVKFELESNTTIEGKDLAYVATNLNLQSNEKNTRQFTGKNMYFGVKLYPYGIIENTPDAVRVACKPD